MTTDTTAPALPFSGLKIVSFAQLVQGPETGKLFADLGGEVIRIEKVTDGSLERHWSGANAVRDGESYLFHAVGRNQLSVALDLSREEGIQVALSLIEEADVVIENFRPGVMRKLGLDYDTLAQTNPRLVYLSATGYGRLSPYAGRPGQDLLIQALSGLASSTGRASDPPIPAGAAVVDYHAAVLNAFGICAALSQRDRTGRGQLVESNLYDAALHLQSEALFYMLNGWPVGERSESGVADISSPAPYGIYPTSDGYLAISDAPLSDMARALDLDELREFTEDEAFTRRDEVRQIVARRTQAMTSNELELALTEAKLWCGPVVALSDVPMHEQFTYRRRVFTIDTPQLGDVTHLVPPVVFSQAPVESLPRQSPPRLGEHTSQILKTVGYPPERIQEMHEARIIFAAELQ